MSSAVANLYSNFLSRKVEFRLFNGNLKAVESNYDGETYVIPGRLQFHVVNRKTGETWPEPGVLPIKGKSGKVFSKKGVAVDKADPITAQQIVEFLVGPDGITGKLGPSGVRVLLPDGDQDGRNDLIRNDAIEQADRKQYADAQRIVRTHENANDKRREYKQDPLPPNPIAAAAYKFIAQKDTEGTPMTFPFSCSKCAEGARTSEDLREHINTIHRLQAPALLKDAGLGAEAIEASIENAVPPVPKRRGRPPMVRA